MHMGTDEDMATQIGEPITLTVCEKCAIEKEYPVAAMAEMGTDKEEE